MSWITYIIQCSDNTLYTGITTDLSKRIDAHNQGKNGAKYTRSRRPVKVVFAENYPTRSTAAKREYQIKRLSLTEKRKLINAGNSFSVPFSPKK